MRVTCDGALPIHSSAVTIFFGAPLVFSCYPGPEAVSVPARPPSASVRRILERLWGRAGADQVTVAVGAVDTPNRRPVLVLAHRWHGEHRGPAVVGMWPIPHQRRCGVRR